jgi:hydroxymethylglutaryl-CoA reductase
VTASFAAIKTEADATTRVGRLHDIEQFAVSRFMFLRFNFTTGDAAGQNLTGQATLRAAGRGEQQREPLGQRDRGLLRCTSWAAS